MGLSRTLAATWEDAGRYMVVGVQSFNQSDVSSFWSYKVYPVRLPAMQLAPCDPEIDIVTQPVTITVGGGSDTLSAMQLRSVEWNRPAIAAEAVETYTVTLTHAGTGVQPLTITIKVNRDGSIEEVTQTDTAGWTETINGQYKAGDGSVRDFVMTLSPAVSEQREATADGGSRVTGYRVTLADIAGFDQTVKDAMPNWQNLNRTFTDKAAVTAVPAAGTTPGAPPLLVSSATGEVAVLPGANN